MKLIFYNRTDNARLINRVGHYKCISFDVFDTLIKRNLRNPTDLYEVMGRKVKKKYGISGFDTLRYESEKELYRENQNVTLDSIYRRIQEKLKDIDCEVLKAWEIDYEISYCQSNKYIKEVYDCAKAQGKKVIAISDMYLPKGVIEDILEKCGYDIDSLYVSCEYMATKRSGSLFKIALENEKLNPKDVLHIGDSLRADYIGARKIGISPYKIERNRQYFNVTRFYNNIDQKNVYNIHRSIIDNNFPLQSSYYEQFGFSILGPALFSFCMWIESECKKENIKDVYFFSRDGYIMKRAFDIVSHGFVRTKYLCVSRRALRVPYNAEHFQIQDVIKLLPTTNQICVETVFEYLNLNVDNYTDLLKKYGLNKKTTIYHHDLKEKYISLLEQLIPDYRVMAKEELNMAIAYLRENDVKGKIAVVDIGWHNSMQHCLEAILKDNNIPSEVHGLYFGVQSNAFGVDHSKGFIIEPCGKKDVDSTTAYIGLIESFFLEQKGTVIKYQKENKKIIPVREVYEFEENSIEFDAYRDIHEGAVEYVNTIKKLIDNEELALNGHDAYLPIWSFGIHPYCGDVDKFDRFRYFSEGVYYLVGYKGILHYILHIKSLKTDLYNARWKAGFLKKLLRFNLRYDDIYRLLKGIKK